MSPQHNNTHTRTKKFFFITTTWIMIQKKATTIQIIYSYFYRIYFFLSCAYVASPDWNSSLEMLKNKHGNFKRSRVADGESCVQIAIRFDVKYTKPFFKKKKLSTKLSLKKMRERQDLSVIVSNTHHIKGITQWRLSTELSDSINDVEIKTIINSQNETPQT